MPTAPTRARSAGVCTSMAFSRRRNSGFRLGGNSLTRLFFGIDVFHSQLWHLNGMTDATQADYPQRIVCLTEETTETLYLLGEQHRIVGISGFTVRPPRARREKPRVSAFLSAQQDKILALRPDLV